MKTIIIALNSKYIHAALAPWYLKAGCEEKAGEVKVLEYTINDNPDSILAAIYREKAEVVSFSCYIWNIGVVHKLSENLKKVSPHTVIIFGGPEVSYDGEDILKRYPYVDYIIKGEGEEGFPRLLVYLASNNGKLCDIPGLVYRNNEGSICAASYTLVKDLNSIQSPYTQEMLARLGNRIVYFESSRGCPFQCSYCISSTFEGVRYFSLERVFHDLRLLVENGVKQIKFVDRTFNCSKERAKKIFQFVINLNTHTNFHFEVAADLFDEEMLELLAACPPGRIQFEIGVQSTNSNTLEAIHRATSINQVFSNVKRILQTGNIHTHLDVIAGLPLEDYPSFQQSFNEVYNLKPHQFQLGFLKLLKGSRIRAEAVKYQYMFRNDPPYEVLCNQFLSYDELLEFKGVEDLIDRYYNSGRFIKTLDYLIRRFFVDSYSFYLTLHRYMEKGQWLERGLSSRDLYRVLLKFSEVVIHDRTKDLHEREGQAEIINELLKYDFLCSDSSGSLPEGIKRQISEGFTEKSFAFLRDESQIKLYLPHMLGESSKSIYKRVHFEEFIYDISLEMGSGYQEGKVTLLFDYSYKDVVSGRFTSRRLPEI